ncbi:MAG: hypothetical protein RIS84_802 [Pseudomonadota bacterium]
MSQNVTTLNAKFDHMSLRLLFIFFSLAYLILSMHLPVTLYTNAVHDDALFWENAIQILQGNWLGVYNQLTLAKGAGFPLFLAFNKVLGIPVTLLMALLYLLACLLIANALSKLEINKYLILGVFIIVLFHPELFPWRVTRDNIYPALSLIVIAGAFQFVLTQQKKDWWSFSIIGYGFIFGLYWITREEGIWIIPGLVVLIVLKLWQLKKQALPSKHIFYKFFSFSLAAAVFLSAVAFMNYHYYGKFELVDMKGAAFSQAVKSLNSVDAGLDLPYIPVSAAKRQEIYKISPSFLQLKDYFEGTGRAWTTAGCGMYPWTCGDYAGGWFVWALRDAVFSKGYYREPISTASFYDNITMEIETACNKQLIKCSTHPIPLMPNISLLQLTEFPEKLVKALKIVLVQHPVPINGGASLEPLDRLRIIRQLLNRPLTMPAINEHPNLGISKEIEIFSKIKILLSDLYKWVIPLLFFLGAFVYVRYIFLMYRRKVTLTNVFIVSTALWCLFFSRIFLLVLVDISSFHAMHELYMFTAFPISCLAALLSLQLLFSKTIVVVSDAK